MKSISRLTLILILLVGFSPSAFALTRSQAIARYQVELESVGLDAATAEQKSNQDVEAAIDSMESAQSDVDYAFDALSDRVDSLQTGDARKDPADAAIDRAESAVGAFKGMSPQQELDVQDSVAGALPRVLFSSNFELAHEEALAAMRVVNQILIAPSRPGAVPEGDLVADFIPQLIRQLFRFAWLAVLVSLVVSGVMFVMAQDNDEKITKAKSMIYYSLIGFAFIALAFAIVKGVTDIDFFRFI